MPKDVIFVPGLPGSKLFTTGPRGGREVIFPRPMRRLAELLLKDVDPRLLGPDRLEDPDPIEAGDPIDRTKLLFVDMKQARSLYDILVSECGLAANQIHKVGWDWRRPVSDPTPRARLRTAIRGAPVGSVLILHSTGGLVARSVLEADPALCDRLSAVVAFGVPWIGTLKSLAVLLKRESLSAADRNDARRVMAHSWAAIDLLPRQNAGLTVKGNGQPYDLFASVDWLPASPHWLRRTVEPKLARSLRILGTPDPAWQLPVDLHNVAGFGERTTVSARIAGNQVQINVTGSGAALDFDALRQGDGTIPFKSASAARGDRVSAWIVPIGAYRRQGRKTHSSLWLNPGAIKTLRHVVAELPRESLTELALDTSAYSPNTEIRLRYSVHDANGLPVAGRIRITTPALAGTQNSFPTQPKGFGTLVLARSRFQRFRQAGTRMRRIRAELANSADGSTAEVFALVPA